MSSVATEVARRRSDDVFEALESIKQVGIRTDQALDALGVDFPRSRALIVACDDEHVGENIAQMCRLINTGQKVMIRDYMRFGEKIADAYAGIGRAWTMLEQSVHHDDGDTVTEQVSKYNRVVVDDDEFVQLPTVARSIRENANKIQLMVHYLSPVRSAFRRHPDIAQMVHDLVERMDVVPSLSDFVADKVRYPVSFFYDDVGQLTTGEGE